MYIGHLRRPPPRAVNLSAPMAFVAVVFFHAIVSAAYALLVPRFGLPAVSYGFTLLFFASAFGSFALWNAVL